MCHQVSMGLGLVAVGLAAGFAAAAFLGGRRRGRRAPRQLQTSSFTCKTPTLSVTERVGVPCLASVLASVDIALTVPDLTGSSNGVAATLQRIPSSSAPVSSTRLPAATAEVTAAESSVATASTAAPAASASSPSSDCSWSSEDVAPSGVDSDDTGTNMVFSSWEDMPATVEPSAAESASRDEMDVTDLIARGKSVLHLGRGGFGRADLYCVPEDDSNKLMSNGDGGGGPMKRLMVLKTLLPRPADDVESRTAALHREAAAMRAAVECPSAVRLYGCSHPQADEDPHHLLMEYVAGGTLAEHLDALLSERAGTAMELDLAGRTRLSWKELSMYMARPLMPWPELRALASALLGTVAALHAHNLCHGDIRPENLIRMPDVAAVGAATGAASFADASPAGVRYKVIDFGMSHKADEHGVLPVAGGTADYSSPEVYALLTRQPVPEGGSRVEPCLLSDLPPIGYILLDCAGLRGVPSGLHKFAREGGALPEGYPAAFVDFVLRLTAQDPAKRGSAQEMLCHRWLQQDAGGSAWL